MKTLTYSRILLMAAISFVMMYAVMFLNVDDTSHIFLSLNRTYMALLMVLPMQVLMVLMMGKMYPSKKANVVIVLSCAVAFFLVLSALRFQLFVSDREYMKGMIPHHSSAIMTSKQAQIRNEKVKELSEQIIESQNEEIAKMKKLLETVD